MLRPRITISVLLALGVAANAASDNLDIKTGLWEMTYTTETQGTLVPQSALEKLPPEQRAKVVAAMNARAAKGPQTSSAKTCVTADDLKEGAFRSENEKDSDCTYSLGTRTSTVQEQTVVCTGEDARRGTFKVEALSRDRIKASYNGEGSNGKIATQISGKWLSASCAGADDD